VTIGIALIGIGVVTYILYGILFNFYLAKNDPEALELDKTTFRQKKAIYYVRHVKSGTVPPWVDTFVLVAMLSFLLGVLVTIGCILFRFC